MLIDADDVVVVRSPCPEPLVVLVDVEEASAAPCTSAVVLAPCALPSVVDDPTLVAALVASSPSVHFVEAPSVSTAVVKDTDVAVVSAIVDFDASVE